MISFCSCGLRVLKIVLLVLISYLSVEASSLRAPPLKNLECTPETIVMKLCVSELNESPVPLKFSCNDINNYPEISAEFVAAFNLAPAWLKPMICHVDQYQVISSEADGDYSAWSVDKPLSKRMIALNKNDFVGRHHTSHLGKWFMGGKHRLADESEIPVQYGAIQIKNIPGLAVLTEITHEIGHLLQNPNDPKIQEKFFWNCNSGFQSCEPFKPSQFGYSSWIDRSFNSYNGGMADIFLGHIKPENEDLYKFFIPVKNEFKTFPELESYHHKIYASGFASPFAAASPVEDFAETFSMVVMAEIVSHWEFNFTDNSSIDVMNRLKKPTDPIILQKIKFVQQITSDFESNDYF